MGMGSRVRNKTHMFPTMTVFASCGTQRWVPPGMGGKVLRIALLQVHVALAVSDPSHVNESKAYMTAVRYGMSWWCFGLSAFSPAG